MLDHLPLDLAHAIAARVDPDTRESAWLAAPRLLPQTAATLEVPAEATAARSAAAAWLRSRAASVRGLETRAVLRVHPAQHRAGSTDRAAVRAALEALKASGRRVSALELVSAAAAGATTTAIVDARAFFEDARELLGGSLREVLVRDVELVVVVVAEEETAAAATATTTTPPPLLLDSLELDGAVTPDDLGKLVEAAIRPCVRSTARLTLRLRQQQQQQQQPSAELIARACAALSRDALGRPYLREVEVLGLPFKDAAGLEEVRRCIAESTGRLARLRLGLGSAGVAAAATAANATTATTTTASILEAEWRGDGPLNNALTLASLSVHARVADPDAFADALAAAAAPLGGASPPCLLAAVESLTLLLAPAAVDKDDDDRLARLLRSMPHLKRLRLAIMATSTFPGGGGPLLKRALAAVAAADPPSLASLELCGGLAAVNAGSAAELLAPLMMATESSTNLRRSLKALKVAAAFVVDGEQEEDGASTAPRLATALPSLRWLALNNLMVGSSGEATASYLLPTLHVADLPAGLERLDVRGWALAEPAASARPSPPPLPALARLSLRECAFSPAAVARLGPNVAEVVLCGSSNAFWRRSEREADRLARAWPRMRSLALGGTDDASLPALVAAAARRCPSLRELRLQGLAELDPRALAQALRPAARTLRVLDVAAAANAGGGGEEEAAAPTAAATAPPPPPPDAAGVARAVAPLEALRRLRVKAPGWRFDGAGAALAAAIARPWLAVEAVCGPPPRLGAAAAALPAAT